MAFSTHDQVPDSPTNVFATFNALYPASISVSDGNLTTGAFLATAGSVTSSMQMLSNAITYFEVYYETSYSDLLNIGLMENYNTSSSWGIRGDGEPWNNAPQTGVSINFTSGDVLGVIVDAPNNRWYLAKNGSLQLSANISNGTGYIHNNLTSNLSLRCWNASSSGNQKIRVNFGQDHLFGGATLPSGAGSYTPDNGIGTFAFSVPSGAKALCTSNLPASSIDVASDDLPEDYFKAVTYTGNGSVRDINTGFQPDLVWTKPRNVASSNNLIDSVRGVLKYLRSDGTGQEGTYSGSITSFNTNGYSLGTGADFNTLNDTYVAWCFRAGGSPTADNTATSGAMTANSVSVDGTLQSSYTPSGSPTIYPKRMSVNTKAGFSIVAFNSGSASSTASIPHGLSQKPDFIIVKNISTNATAWFTWHSSFATPSNYLYLHLPSGLSSLTQESTMWGNGHDANKIGFRSDWGLLVNDNHIAYCWHSVEGYSAFGSYEGNGSTDGPFVYTGFKPAWLLLKNIDLDGDWWLMDTTRDTYNVAEKVLYPNLSGSEYVGASVFGRDFLSNGFKVRNNNFGVNGSYTYIYAAFAEMPFKYANAR